MSFGRELPEIQPIACVRRRVRPDDGCAAAALAVRRFRPREVRSGTRAGTSIAGRFFRNIGSRSGSTTRMDSTAASTIGSAPSQKGLCTADMAPTQRGLSTPPSSGRAIISKALERPLRLTASKATTMTLLSSKTPSRQARHQALVLGPPERREGEPLEFTPVGRADPRTGKPEDGFAACIALEDEGIGEQRLDVGRLDFGTLRGGATSAKPIPILEQRD